MKKNKQDKDLSNKLIKGLKDGSICLKEKVTQDFFDKIQFKERNLKEYNIKEKVHSIDGTVFPPFSLMFDFIVPPENTFLEAREVYITNFSKLFNIGYSEGKFFHSIRPISFYEESINSVPTGKYYTSFSTIFRGNIMEKNAYAQKMLKIMLGDRFCN